jgi:hypothetical protein
VDNIPGVPLRVRLSAFIFLPGSKKDTVTILNAGQSNNIMKPISFVTRLLRFNPTDLMSRTLRRRRLLKNPDVVEMLRVAHSFGESSEKDEIFGGDKGEYTFQKLVEFLKE